MKTILHVDMATLKSNAIQGRNDPPIVVRRDEDVQHVQAVEILGPSKLINGSACPLPCGVRVWIETEADIICCV